MFFPERPIAFVLVSSNHGTMIVNRNDHAHTDGFSFGVGHQLLTKSGFDESEVRFALEILSLRRRYFGDGVFAVDGGANIGVHSIEWARHMYGWGRVLGFEAQEVVFYALAGNLAVNNCLNARVKLAALGARAGELSIPQPDYYSAGSFGSLELRQSESNQLIGQPVSYEAHAQVTVPMISIDSLNLERLDFFKLDVEGMEIEALEGARETIERCKPVLLVEWLKTGEPLIRELLGQLGYDTFYSVQPNVIAIHNSDPLRTHFNERDGVVFLT
jgi:FkbM family methyltransferase